MGTEFGCNLNEKSVQLEQNSEKKFPAVPIGFVSEISEDALGLAGKLAEKK